MGMNDEIVASSFAVAQLMFGPSNVHIDLRTADLRTTLATVIAIVQRDRMTPTQVVEYLIDHGSRFDREVMHFLIELVAQPKRVAKLWSIDVDGRLFIPGNPL